MGGSLGSIINPTLEFLAQGFDRVNAVQGLLIALFAVVVMRSWRQLFVIALFSTAIYLVVAAVIPVVGGKGVNLSDIRLPNPMNAQFWNDTATLYVGFVMIIAMFFAVKSVVFLRGGGGRKARAHG